MVTKLLLLLPFVAIVRAEVDFTGGRIAPYAPAGWHPQIPFNLPNEYVPPIRPGQEVEITKARVDQFDPVEKSQPNYLPPKQLNIPEEEILSTSRPSNQYGPPDPKFKIIYPDDEEPVTAKDIVDNQQPKIREGRYFVISQDNKLQRVTFSSQQNENAEDFMAQLTYSTVGQLKDPVYRYNSQGQLERVLK
ncbi:uncharacterized protein LOC6735364 [Drosophila simulans]|uniref:DUF4794 domain-containing protein n=1 Tax=Drosophila simulans TaxID=7240 RepID=A0A0J9U6N4_DROSI|nr:uncharacterized protein LOC6735364 [Drosophila simulans]KMY95240.1 uncharacterized protein Dsimw501_GD11504 [Drosophila simulans]